MANFSPYTRSRTLLFLSYRDSASRPHRGPSSLGVVTTAGPSTSTSSSAYYDTPALESRALLSDVADTDGSGWNESNVVIVAPPPRWVAVAEKVDAILVTIKPKLERLDKLHAKHLLPGFKDRSAEEREIAALAAEITSDFRSAQTHIQRIARIATDLLQSSSSRSDLIMAANVQTALGTRIQELSSVFRKKQTEYLRRLKAQQFTSPSSSSSRDHHHDNISKSPSFFDSSPGNNVSPSSSAGPLSPSFQQSYMTPSSSTLHPGQIEQRTSEILTLAASINDLSDLFKDLSGLVLTQGTVLDRIDWNVEQMAGNVQGAASELKIAQGHQRRSGKCGIIFLLILLITGAVIIIAYRPSKDPVRPLPPSNSSPDPPPSGDVLFL